MLITAEREWLLWAAGEARVGSLRETNAERQESQWSVRITVELQALEEVSCYVSVNALRQAPALFQIA